MSARILDFVARREELIEKKRRGFERAVFANFLGTYCLVEDRGREIPIDIVDISRSGLAFRTGEREFRPRGELTLKLYFNRSHYICVFVKVVRHQDGLYGCTLDQSTASYGAISALVDFLHQFAEHSATDMGSQRATSVR